MVARQTLSGHQKAPPHASKAMRQAQVVSMTEPQTQPGPREATEAERVALMHIYGNAYALALVDLSNGGKDYGSAYAEQRARSIASEAMASTAIRFGIQ